MEGTLPLRKLAKALKTTKEELLDRLSKIHPHPVCILLYTQCTLLFLYDVVLLKQLGCHLPLHGHSVAGCLIFWIFVFPSGVFSRLILSSISSWRLFLKISPWYLLYSCTERIVICSFSLPVVITVEFTYPTHLSNIIANPPVSH